VIPLRKTGIITSRTLQLRAPGRRRRDIEYYCEYLRLDAGSVENAAKVLASSCPIKKYT